MLIDIEILIVEVELIGGARGCGQTGFAFGVGVIFLGGGSCGGSRLVDVRGYLMCR